LPGFWSGLLHGFLIVFSFIGSLFTDVRIYSFPNSGGWYDFGYVLGAAMFLGGGGGLYKLGDDEDGVAGGADIGLYVCAPVGGAGSAESRFPETLRLFRMPCL